MWQQICKSSAWESRSSRKNAEEGHLFLVDSFCHEKWTYFVRITAYKNHRYALPIHIAINKYNTLSSPFYKGWGSPWCREWSRPLPACSRSSRTWGSPRASTGPGPLKGTWKTNSIVLIKTCWWFFCILLHVWHQRRQCRFWSDLTYLSVIFLPHPAHSWVPVDFWGSALTDVDMVILLKGRSREETR